MITQTKILFIVHRGRALKIVSDVRIIVVSQLHGTATVTMIVATELTNRQNIVNLKDVPVSVISLLVIMEIAFLEFIFAMGIMIVWIILMKMIGINAVSNFSIYSFLLKILFFMKNFVLFFKNR